MTNEGKPDLSRATTPSLNNRLEETLDQYYAPIKLPEYNRSGLLTQIESDLLGLIGEDEGTKQMVGQISDTTGIRNDALIVHTTEDEEIRNTLRAELRTQITNYCRGSNTDATE